MRIFASGPRIANGFVRFGVSFQAPTFGRVFVFILLMIFWIGIIAEQRQVPAPAPPMPYEVDSYPPVE